MEAQVSDLLPAKYLPTPPSAIRRSDDPECRPCKWRDLKRQKNGGRRIKIILLPPLIRFTPLRAAFGCLSRFTRLSCLFLAHLFSSEVRTCSQTPAARLASRDKTKSWRVNHDFVSHDFVFSGLDSEAASCSTGQSRSSSIPANGEIMATAWGQQKIEIQSPSVVFIRWPSKRAASHPTRPPPRGPTAAKA